MEHYFTSNQNLRSEIRTISYENKGQVFHFFSDLGVFSKDRIDYGSRLLVDTILENVSSCSSILDVGCGYGFLGIILAYRFSSQVTMVDVNKRALHLCERNIKHNSVLGKCFLSNAYENVTGTYDLIVTNPPIRAGKETVLKILLDAKNHFNKDASLWFVIRKDQGAKSILKVLENVYDCKIVKKEKGFYIMCAKIH